MTAFEWVMIALTAVGVVLTSIGMIVATTRSVTRSIAKLEKDVERKIANEALMREKALAEAIKARDEKIAQLHQEFREEQDTQDHNVGEMGNALRRFIESVNDKIREVELWGRDHYVKVPDFTRAIESLSNDMRQGFSSIRVDLNATRTELRDEIKHRNAAKD